MAKRSVNGSQGDVAVPSLTNTDDGGLSPRLQGLDSNPHGAFGPQFWQAFRGAVAHLYQAAEKVS